MELNKMSKEDLELHSYTDLTKMILEENSKSLSTPEVFKEICSLLGLSDDEYAEKIGDYYTSLTTDKRFIFLENGTWDLKDKHKVNVVLDEDEEENEDEDIEDITEENDEPELEYDTLEEGVDEDDDVDDDIEDFQVIDEEDIEEED